MKTMKYTLCGLVIAAMAFILPACSDDDGGSENISAKTVFNVLGTIDDAYYLAQSKTLTEGTLSFVNNGTQLAADQAARIIASGDYIYSLNYGTGLLTQMQPNTTGGYDVIKEINAGLSVGTNRPRFGLADESTIIVYNVVVAPVRNDEDEVIDNTCTLRIASIALPSLSIASLTQFNIPQSEAAKEGATIGYHPMRVDSPVIAGGKIYFGLMHMDMYNPSLAPPFRVPKQTGLETLVFDYPAFTNGKVVTTDAASGHTSGYRSHSMHKDENGDVYQSNWFMTANKFDLSAGDKTVITRLKNGTYDASYVFNISEKLGVESNIGAVGWFYVGNGIGYMPIHMEAEGHYTDDNSWGLLRIDVYNKKVTRLNVPQASLFSYESGIVNNGKFYMAISPIEGEAFIYEFDPTSESADAFKKGLQLDGGNLQIEGVY